MDTIEYELENPHSITVNNSLSLNLPKMKESSIINTTENNNTTTTTTTTTTTSSQSSSFTPIQSTPEQSSSTNIPPLLSFSLTTNTSSPSESSLTSNIVPLSLSSSLAQPSQPSQPSLSVSIPQSYTSTLFLPVTPKQQPPSSPFPPISDKLVRLNIGGIKYIASKETVSAHSTFLRALLCGDCGTSVDGDGYYFIDRDGDLFAPILSYMRTGNFNIKSFSSAQLSRLQREVDFYGMPTLMDLLDPVNHGGGEYFITRLKTDTPNSQIVTTISKANVLAIAYDNGIIELWIYKGLTYHWILLTKLELPFLQLNGLTMTITKNSFNEVTHMILCAFSPDKELQIWKLKIEHVLYKTIITYSHMIIIEHYIHFTHFLVNGHYLALISKVGKITVVEIGQDNIGNEVPMKMLNVNRLVNVIADIDNFLYLGCEGGVIVEMKQNLRDNWDWNLDDVYRVTKLVFNTSTYLSETINTAEARRLSDSSRQQDSPELVSVQSLLAEVPAHKHANVITAISLIHIQQHNNNRVVLAIGMLDGCVYLAFRNTRRNDPYVFGASMPMTSREDPIVKLMVTGGNEGLFVTAIAKSNLTKTWQYKYTNSSNPRALRCISIHQPNTAISSFRPSTFYDILKFKTFHYLHFHNLKTPQLESSNNHQVSLNQLFNANTLDQIVASANPPPEPPKRPAHSSQSNPHFTPVDPTNQRYSVSLYNQIYVTNDGDGGNLELLVYAQSHRCTGESFPTKEELAGHLDRPLAVIPMVDTSPVVKVITTTYGGVEPNLNDISYMILTVHDNNSIYCWDLRPIDILFGPQIKPEKKKRSENNA